jgi:hypothetical protein
VKVDVYLLGIVSDLVIMFVGLDTQYKARPSLNSVTVAVTLDLITVVPSYTQIQYPRFTAARKKYCKIKEINGS